MPPSNSDHCLELLAAVGYGTCSVGMTFVNKALLATFSYNYPFFIMTTQMLFTMVLFDALRVFNVLDIPAYSLARGRSFLFPSLFYGLHSVLALSALTNMNIPMYSLLKRCTPLVTLFLGVTLLKKDAPSWRLISAVVMITGGCIVAGT